MPFKFPKHSDSDIDSQIERAQEADQKDRLRYGGGSPNRQLRAPEAFPGLEQILAKGPDLVIQRGREDIAAVMEPSTQKPEPVREPGPTPETQE